ncbi:hypothetical protein [Streptomyces sp. NBC_00334]|uniref:hypothetical protein n=1 Tax=Streptomyces sp. NBC_00334 TaxID=2975713 RepID=UPI002E2AB485|nr:hypothetical protein [Streptomyces sp. NBC_00334]
MTPETSPQDPAQEAKHRRDGLIAFAVGAAASLAFFAFFPSLPHVIDWGAILVSLAVGALTRWAWLARTRRKRTSVG